METINECIELFAHQKEIIATQRICPKSIESCMGWKYVDYVGYRPVAALYEKNNEFDADLLENSNEKPYHKII